MKKILVPTDFSKTAQTAVGVAADVARKAGAELIMLHVVEEASGSSFNVEGEAKYGGDSEETFFTLKLIERAKKQMAKALEDSKLAGLKVRQELRVGSAFHGMTTIIAEKKVDLVVMGTAGSSDLENMVIGSNTEKVVRTSHCPVLVVNKKTDHNRFQEYRVRYIHERRRGSVFPRGKARTANV